MKTLFLILLYTFTMHTVNSEDDQRESNGYCTTLVSRNEPRLVSYRQSYRERTWGIFYKTKYRWNYRTEYHRVWNKETNCCYQYKKVSNKCVPICYRDCGNGDCIRPNTCSCHYGYIETSVSEGPVCGPHCENPCFHGRCVAPNKCICDDGYQLNSDGFTCEPVCEPNCDLKTEVCTAPNTCSCLDGYNKTESTTCMPVCEVTCSNGQCTAPETCTCNEGYSTDLYDQFLCNPVCSKCIDGTCTAPEICTCQDGYFLNDEGVCKPICSQGCHMGTCIAPETCMCDQGYGFSNDSTNVCEPICPKACINGVCVKPDICECHEGFKVVGDETSLHVCKPHCDMSCEPEGDCTAPNVCTCHEGYSFDDKHDYSTWFSKRSVCKPICEKECVNGYCARPGICECWIGYERSDDIHTCKPVCKFSCWSHSSCTSPGRCTCDEGYMLKPNKEFLMTVTNEYTEFTCEPICEKDCVNGFCSSPGECSCHSGYAKSEANVCKPVCESACWPNSSCTAPEVCTCDKNYYLIIDLNDSSRCAPICQPACPTNSFCESPGLCLCEDGYLLIKNNDNTICQPICEFPCNNGTCTSPNTCTCELGYVNNENGTCIPHCTIDCGNGTCIEPDICSCDEGYALVNGSLTCKPYCENNCDNGDCVAPDDCRCHTGFFKNGNESNSICVSACKDACNKKGDCIDDRGNCDCYFGWNGTNCDEPTICVVVVKEEYPIYETLSLTRESNDSMIFASASNPTCQQCLAEVNNETICYESLYDNIGERNYSAICFVDANSMCFATHKPAERVLKIGIAVGGAAVLLTILSTVFACLKFKKNKKKLVIGKSTENISNQSLLSEDNTNL